jgi:hypothetical protein
MVLWGVWDTRNWIGREGTHIETPRQHNRDLNSKAQNVDWPLDFEIWRLSQSSPPLFLGPSSVARDAHPRPHASLATSLACARTARPLLSFLCLVVVVAAAVVVVVFLLVFECPRYSRNQTQKFNITGNGLSQSRWTLRSCSSCMQQCNVQCLMQAEEERGNGKEAGREFVLGLR